MAILDVGGNSGSRDLNHELPLVPFIDFLLCIVAFLLVTAVWSEMARIDANAGVPAVTKDAPEPPTAEFHVDMRARSRFVLAWRHGSTVVVQEEMAREQLAADASPHYAKLSRRISELWASNGVHRAPGDARRDRAVLHASNDATFEEIVAAMDAIAGARRASPGGASGPAFDVVFAAD